MNNFGSIVNKGLPAIIGLGIAWVGIRIIRNEHKIEQRVTELEIQLGAKSLKSS